MGLPEGGLCSRQLAEALDNRDHFVYRIDFGSGRYDYVSPAAAALFGIAPERFMAEGMETLERHMDPGDMRRCLEHYATLCAAQPGCEVRTRVEYTVTTAAGERRRFSDSVTVLADAEGRPSAAYGIASDVTAYWRIEQAMHEGEHRFSAIMDAAQVGIFVLQDSRFCYVNPHLAAIFGFSAEELLSGMGLLDLVAPGARDKLAQQLARRLAGEGERPYEIVAKRRDDSTFPATLLYKSIAYDGQPAAVGTILDLSALKAAESRILELAYFDRLTGLPNRHLLRDRATQVLATAEREHDRVALMCIDLDHFKRVNDSLGHSVGDALLCAVAERLRATVRKVDTLARPGGDEFAIVLPGTHASAAAEIAKRLIDLYAQPFSVGGHNLALTPSIGITLFPEDGKDFETLLKNADAAMYQAKKVGRNGFQFYATEMNVAALEHLLIESNLRSALAKDEFVLHYQPLVALESGRIVGVEALIRWRHPEIGMIPPSRFIPVAEDSGLINPIGDWVLCEACRQMQRWRESGIPPLSVAVNVSPVQFRQSGFVEMVAGALAATGLEANLLELELTERTVMHDAEINLGKMSALHRMGVELSVDDFGTGYSSLAYLKRFPVGKLKIDRSFVSEIVENADDLAIASTIISMGRSLRLKVLAEGVETQAQLDLLRQQGCALAQGYYFAQPLPADECAELLRRQPFLISGDLWRT